MALKEEIGDCGAGGTLPSITNSKPNTLAQVKLLTKKSKQIKETTDGAAAGGGQGASSYGGGRGVTPTKNKVPRKRVMAAEGYIREYGSSGYGVITDRPISTKMLNGQGLKTKSPKKGKLDSQTDVDRINEDGVAMSIGGGSVAPIAPPDASAVYSLQRERYKKMLLKGLARRAKPKTI